MLKTVPRNVPREEPNFVSASASKYAIFKPQFSLKTFKVWGKGNNVKIREDLNLLFH